MKKAKVKTFQLEKIKKIAKHIDFTEFYLKVSAALSKCQKNLIDLQVNSDDHDINANYRENLTTLNNEIATFITIIKENQILMSTKEVHDSQVIFTDMQALAFELLKMPNRKCDAKILFYYVISIQASLMRYVIKIPENTANTSNPLNFDFSFMNPSLVKNRLGLIQAILEDKIVTETDKKMASKIGHHFEEATSHLNSLPDGTEKLLLKAYYKICKAAHLLKNQRDSLDEAVTYCNEAERYLKTVNNTNICTDNLLKENYHKIGYYYHEKYQTKEAIIYWEKYIEMANKSDANANLEKTKFLIKTIKEKKYNAVKFVLNQLNSFKQISPTHSFLEQNYCLILTFDRQINFYFLTKYFKKYSVDFSVDGDKNLIINLINTDHTNLIRAFNVAEKAIGNPLDKYIPYPLANLIPVSYLTKKKDTVEPNMPPRCSNCTGNSAIT